MFVPFRNLKSLSLVKKVINRHHLPSCGRQTCICVDKLIAHSFQKNKKEYKHLKKTYDKCFATCQRWH